MVFVFPFNNPDLVKSPLTMSNGETDLFAEIFEIVDSCTFSAKAISPTMWQAFELMHESYKNGGELYLEGGHALRNSWLTNPVV